MSNVDLLQAQLREYLRALRDMLQAAKRPDWPVHHALSSLDDVLQHPRPDLDREAEYLRDRLAELRHARRRPDERQVQVAYQVTHGRRPDGWWYVVEVPGRPREEHGPFIDEDNVIAAKVARMEELEAGIVDPVARDCPNCKTGVLVEDTRAGAFCPHCGWREE